MCHQREPLATLTVFLAMIYSAEFHADSVLAAIYDQRNERRVIWSPSTTLSAMNIEHYPHMPQTNYRKMKRILRQLCNDGQLVQRPELHSRYTMNEVAYSRVDGLSLHDGT